MFYLKHWLLTCIRLFQAFVLFQKGTATLAFYADLTQRTEVVKTGFLMASLVIGDAMIVRISLPDDLAELTDSQLEDISLVDCLGIQ
jgi:hypothetical protein